MCWRYQRAAPSTQLCPARHGSEASRCTGLNELGFAFSPTVQSNLTKDAQIFGGFFGGGWFCLLHMLGRGYSPASQKQKCKGCLAIPELGENQFTSHAQSQPCF